MLPHLARASRRQSIPRRDAEPREPQHSGSSRELHPSENAAGWYWKTSWLRPAGTSTPRNTWFTRNTETGRPSSSARHPASQRSASTTRPGASSSASTLTRVGISSRIRAEPVAGPLCREFVHYVGDLARIEVRGVKPLQHLAVGIQALDPLRNEYARQHLRILQYVVACLREKDGLVGLGITPEDEIADIQHVERRC